MLFLITAYQAQQSIMKYNGKIDFFTLHTPFGFITFMVINFVVNVFINSMIWGNIIREGNCLWFVPYILNLWIWKNDNWMTQCWRTIAHMSMMWANATTSEFFRLCNNSCVSVTFAICTLLASDRRSIILFEKKWGAEMALQYTPLGWLHFQRKLLDGAILAIKIV